MQPLGYAVALQWILKPDAMLNHVSDRMLRRLLLAGALAGLILGGVAWAYGRADLAGWFWAVATLPVVLALAVSIVRDLMAGRFGVDAVACVSMSAALASARTSQPLWSR